MIHIFNASVCPTIGLTYRTSALTVVQARYIIQGRGREPVQSAIGHEATAAVATELLGIDVPVNRIEAKCVAGDTIIAVKLRSRPPEGRILSRAEMDAIGYDLVMMAVTS